MPYVRRLHRSRDIARFVLVWFALFLGVAAASPLIAPQATELVCSASGSMKLVQIDGGSDESKAGHTLECPLCTGVGLPPAQVVVPFAAIRPSTQRPLLVATEPFDSRSAAPPPARAPPLSA